MFAVALSGVAWWIVNLRDASFRTSRLLVSTGILYISLALTIGGGLVFTALRLYDPAQAADIAIYTRYGLTLAAIPALGVAEYWRRSL